MTRDWLLTLLAMSPCLLAAAILVVALTRKPTKNERDRRKAETSAPRGDADQTEEASPTSHGAATR